MGTMMLEVGQKLGYVTDRDQIRFLDLKKFNEVRNKALDEIEEMSGNIIIDTHASVGENGRYLPGFPVHFLDKLGHVKGLIYIDATTKDIMARRKADKTRKREDDDEPTIDAQRLINISMLSFASAYLNVPLYVVINRHGRPGEDSRGDKEEDQGGNRRLDGPNSYLHPHAVAGDHTR